MIARRAGKPSPLWLLIPAAGACLILAAAGEARSWIGVGIAALAGFALLALARRRAKTVPAGAA